MVEYRSLVRRKLNIVVYTRACIYVWQVGDVAFCADLSIRRVYVLYLHTLNRKCTKFWDETGVFLESCDVGVFVLVITLTYVSMYIEQVSCQLWRATRTYARSYFDDYETGNVTRSGASFREANVLRIRTTTTKH